MIDSWKTKKLQVLQVCTLHTKNCIIYNVSCLAVVSADTWPKHSLSRIARITAEHKQIKARGKHEIGTKGGELWAPHSCHTNQARSAACSGLAD
jgi:hypothetical protein